MSSPTYEPRVLIKRVEQNAPTVRAIASHTLASALLGPAYVVRAALSGTPGMRFHVEGLDIARRLVMHAGTRALVQAGKLVVFPMDSTRYFEFDWVWNRLRRRPPAEHYLDVSSPRLLPLRYVRQRAVRRAVLINPDGRDLAVTRDCVAALGIADKCQLLERPIEQFDSGGDAFDAITSISVLEHIADERSALSTIWKLVKPGGVLLLTLPCTAAGYDQYRDFNEYNLVEPAVDGTYFFQRFYDERSLAERVYSVVGRPSSTAVYGERTPGFFGCNAERKMRGLPYPFWEEPLMMRDEFKLFPSIDALPGEGVIAMEFVKRGG